MTGDGAAAKQEIIQSTILATQKSVHIRIHIRIIYKI